MPITSKCRMSGCNTEPAARGLCMRHYQRARDLVLSERTSWEKLAKLGYVAPPEKAGACRDFDDALFTPEELAERATANQGGP